MPLSTWWSPNDLWMFLTDSATGAVAFMGFSRFCKMCDRSGRGAACFGRGRNRPARRALRGCRTQMARQTRLEEAEQTHDDEIQEQIDQRGADEYFSGAIRLLNDLLRDA